MSDVKGVAVIGAILFLGLLILAACKSNYTTTQGYGVLVIDGCEYLKYDRSITHKGNCTNSIHKR